MSVATSCSHYLISSCVRFRCFLFIQIVFNKICVGKGGIDEAEDPRTAAMRELREETGVNSAEILAEVGLFCCYTCISIPVLMFLQHYTKHFYPCILLSKYERMQKDMLIELYVFVGILLVVFIWLSDTNKVW